MKTAWRIAAVLVLLTALMLSGCSAGSKEEKSDSVKGSPTAAVTEAQTANSIPSGYRQISQDEARRIMETESGYIILDVRTPEEYAGGHIPGAICISHDAIPTDEIPELPDKDQLILIYCRSGRRSKLAAEQLVGQGYTNIAEFGGINTWTGEITTE